jgi:hypothetical protein
MRRAFTVAIPVLLLALSASGQVIHGTPASVTSIGGNGTFIGGVPASVTSISPRLPFGIAPQGSPYGGPGMLIPSALGYGNPLSQGIQQRPGNFGRRSHGPNRFSGFVPLVVPYAYPYAVYTNYDAYGVQPGQQPVQIEIRIVQDGKDQGEQNQYASDGQLRGEPDGSGETRLTMRSDREQPRREAGENAQAAAPAQEPEPAREVIPTVLIFRDGHRQEVRNYAIMGKVLYDLESMTARKIQLAELDIPATIKENDERGVGFTLPRDKQ